MIFPMHTAAWSDIFFDFYKHFNVSVFKISIDFLHIISFW